MTRLATLCIAAWAMGCSKPPTAPQPPPTAPTEAVDPPEPVSRDATRHLIDGKPVEQAAWDALFESMTDEQREWYCDETTNGGEEGWIATDEAGNEYQVTLTSDSMEGSTKEIRRVAAPDEPM